LTKAKKSRKRQALGHKSYGKKLIKEGLRDSAITVADTFTHGAPGFARSGYKIYKGAKHIRKSRRLYHRR